MTTPPSQQGQGPATVRVINPDQQVAVAQDAFTYMAPPPPVINGVSPSSGASGSDGNSLGLPPHAS